MKTRFQKLTVIMIAMFFCFTFAACSGEEGRTIIYETTIVQNTVDIYDLYELYKDENADASFGDFLESLSITYSGTELATVQGLKSAVSVYSTFTYRVMQRPGQYVERDSSSAGAGVIYKIQDDDVFIITNYHVIYDRDSLQTDKLAKSIEVYTYGHEKEVEAISATFMGGDMDKDIAVLKADVDDFQGEIMGVALADSDNIKLGQTVIAIGNPIAAGIAVTSGVISLALEDISMEALDSASRTVVCKVIRTDTAINQGNSGGGLFNMRGELIGIVNAKTVKSGVENMGYAIPSNIVFEVAESVIGG